MAQGMWQFTSPDGQLRFALATALFEQVLLYSSDPTSMDQYYQNDLDALLEQAAAFFQVDRNALLIYYYSDTPTIIQLIVSKEPITVDALVQPWRVVWEMTVDAVTGLITKGGVVAIMQSLFPQTAPLSRQPKP